MSSKGVKRVNVFLLLSDEQYLELIVKELRDICRENSCTFGTHPSKTVKRFYYIDVVPFIDIETVKKRVEDVLNKLSTAISWHKIEVIEVK
ncbi:hypothetical protein QPL79_01155 [Ignisphaera sp. 4213-co]|uniref:DNA-directed RNA polymerase n=1 Tax=Ignisphaera cupida TaxID=3050454 RepID=A0ABD4Z446_9CREN|nr:hypothetical protein [Ignisphaera sp. 4213-co]MDK6027974.1 hypothetical protein [Ignisphaera sp. 4213-co]